jgi:hypothetical protein
MIQITETSAPRRADAHATVHAAADRLHLASLRQTDCLIEALCLTSDHDTLVAILVAVAGTCGPCH